MRIHPFRAVYPNLELIASADSFFGTVKYDYREFERSGFFTKTKSKALYVYRITGPSRIHLGVIASVDIDDYIEGKIIKHEDTLSTKEQDMMNLLLNRKAMIKPVLLTYQSTPEIEKILSEVIQRQPLYNIHFDESNEDHQIWKIKEEREVEALRRAFAHVKKVYIADGHHRCSTSAILHNGQDVNNLDLDFSKLLCAFMSFDQLDIHDYNRGVEILNEISPATLVAILSKYCRIKKMKGPFRPSRKHEVSMLLDKEWFRLRWRSSVMRLYDNEDIILDSMIVTDIIMKKIFKIRDVRSDRRIKYIEGTLGTFGLTQLCTKKPDCVGFGLYPVSMQEFKEISDKGQMLPPKSTWFEPRMKNGFLSQEF